MFLSMLFFFFFKQKTAYEMRISDWSSDVCSSDLDQLRHRLPDVDHQLAERPAGEADRPPPQHRDGEQEQRHPERRLALYPPGQQQRRQADQRQDVVPTLCQGRDQPRHLVAGDAAQAVRSEEHTSELQSLMRISYAVFCLKKKNNTNDIPTIQ